MKTKPSEFVGGLTSPANAAISDRAFDTIHSIDYVVMVILGGNGSLWGAAIAAMTLTGINERLREFEQWRMVAYSFLLLGIMISRYLDDSKRLMHSPPSLPGLTPKSETSDFGCNPSSCEEDGPPKLGCSRVWPIKGDRNRKHSISVALATLPHAKVGYIRLWPN